MAAVEPETDNLKLFAAVPRWLGQCFQSGGQEALYSPKATAGALLDFKFR